MIRQGQEFGKSQRRGMPKLSLKELAAEHPDIWASVVADLRERISENRGEALITWRQAALAELRKTSDDSNSLAKSSSRSVIEAQMTLLAIEQFADVMSGKVATSTKLSDRFRFKFFILSKILSGAPFNVAQFDRRWMRISDPTWAAGELQRSGIWSVPTKEMLQQMSQLCGGRKTLELGAGSGVLYAGLKAEGVNISSVDDGSWQHGELSPSARKYGVQKMDASQALAIHSPEVVVCSWPPPENQFELGVLRTKSVQMYLVILSKQPFASGNWSAYRSQNCFECTTNPALNALLRPVEAEQQLLIFRRR